MLKRVQKKGKEWPYYETNYKAPYAERGVSLFNNRRYGLLLWGGCLYVVSTLVVFKIL